MVRTGAEFDGARGDDVLANGARGRGGPEKDYGTCRADGCKKGGPTGQSLDDPLIVHPRGPGEGCPHETHLQGGTHWSGSGRRLDRALHGLRQLL